MQDFWKVGYRMTKGPEMKSVLYHEIEEEKKGEWH